MTTIAELAGEADGWPDDHPLKPVAQAAACQALALAQASEASPDHYARTLLRRLAAEWKRAAAAVIEDLGPQGTPCEVRGAGALAPGTRVYRPSTSGDWGALVRVMTRDWQVSLHLEDAEGRPSYVNLTTLGSPVVVQP